MDMTPSVNGNVCVGLIAHRHIRGCLRQSSQQNRETPLCGTRQHKIHYQSVKAAAHRSTFQPIRRLTDAFAFHVDQRQAAPRTRMHTIRNSKCSTLKSGGISAPKPKAGNILSLGEEKERHVIHRKGEISRTKLWKKYLRKVFPNNPPQRKSSVCVHV